eukprot:CFRG3238T1
MRSSISGPSLHSAFSITSDQFVYYGGDTIKATLHIELEENFSIPRICVGVFCRYVCKDPSSSHFRRAHTLYSEVKILRKDYYASKGVTPLTFLFTLPNDVPLTLKHSFCNIRWDLRMFNYEGNTDKTLTRMHFHTSSRPDPAITALPAAEKESQGIFQKGASIRLDANLIKPYYQIHQPVTVEYNFKHLSRAVRIRTLRSYIRQHVILHEGCRIVGETKTHLHKTPLKRHTSHRNSMDDPAVDNLKGKLTYNLSTSLPHDVTSDTAVSQFISENGEWITELSPSMDTNFGNARVWVEVKYEIVLKAKLFGARNIKLAVPFILHGSSTESTLATFYSTAISSSAQHNYVPTLSKTIFSCLKPQGGKSIMSQYTFKHSQIGVCSLLPPTINELSEEGIDCSIFRRMECVQGELERRNSLPDNECFVSDFPIETTSLLPMTDNTKPCALLRSKKDSVTTSKKKMFRPKEHLKSKERKRLITGQNEMSIYGYRREQSASNVYEYGSYHNSPLRMLYFGSVVPM